MASGKRILGTVSFVIAFLVMVAFIFVLWAKSLNDPTYDWTRKIDTWAIWAGIILFLCCAAILLAILIRSADERRNRAAEAEEAARLAAMQSSTDAFESTLEEPEGLGKGPEMVIYNTAGMAQMYKAWTRFERKNKAWPFIHPRTVDSGMYTNTYIPIDNEGNQLKLRILLAGPPNAQQGELPVRNTQKATTELSRKQLDSIPEAIRNRLPADVRERYWPTGEAQEEEPMQASGKPGRAVGAEIDEHLAGRNGGSRAYYDYTGDIHNVEDIEGIGRIYGAKLQDAGVVTTARLAYEDADTLARRVGVPKKTVEMWKVMGELMKIKGVGKQYAEAMARAGIDGIAELKRRSPVAIAGQVNGYLDSLETNVLGNKVTEKRVEGWQKAAKSMRKVKLDVPAQ